MITYSFLLLHSDIFNNMGLFAYEWFDYSVISKVQITNCTLLTLDTSDQRVLAQHHGI